MPIILGYLPVSISFGLIAKSTGLSLKDTSFMSFIVYAGASQFMAIDLIKQGLSYGSIILACFLLNLRHLIMSASLSLKFKDVDKKFMPLIAFGITDETFSLVSFSREKVTAPYILTLFFSAHTVWWLGSVFGFVVGEILPKSVQLSLSLGLYGMFAALLFSQVKENKRVLPLAIMSMVIYIIVYKVFAISGGWDIIISILLSSALGSLIFANRGEKI